MEARQCRLYPIHNAPRQQLMEYSTNMNECWISYMINKLKLLRKTLPMASQITSLIIVYSIFHSGGDKKKQSKLSVTGLCAGNSPVTGEFPAQTASNADNVSIWWRHHVLGSMNSSSSDCITAEDKKCTHASRFVVGWYWSILTHWGRATHICVSKLTIIGSGNGLSPDRRQAIIWTNTGLLLIGNLGTNFNEILIEILTFSFKKMRLKASSAKRRPFCLGLDVLTHWRDVAAILRFISWELHVKLLSCDCHRTHDQHCFMQLLGDGRQQDIIWVKIVRDMYENMASLSHVELNHILQDKGTGIGAIIELPPRLLIKNAT